MQTTHITTSSHIGRREEQQDSVGHWSNNSSCLVIVADGVGGIEGGAAASQAIIHSAEQFWNQRQGKFPQPREDLSAMAEAAHAKICELRLDEKRSPASTLVALYIDGDQAHWIHCGDSRLYFFRKGSQQAVTLDHSVVQMLVEQGKIQPSEMNSHPDKGRILKSLGAGSFKGVDYNSSSITQGDSFLLCSDGYWESIPEGQPIFPPKDPNHQLDRHLAMLVRQAVERNGAKSDNTTVAYVQVGEEQKQAPQAQTNSTKQILTIIFYIIILLDILCIIYFLVL